MKHNATLKIITIFRSPPAVHGAMIDAILNHLLRCPSLRENLCFDVRSSSVSSHLFSDALTAPSKIPDLLLQYTKVSGELWELPPPKVIFIAEVGISRVTMICDILWGSG